MSYTDTLRIGEDVAVIPGEPERLVRNLNIEYDEGGVWRQVFADNVKRFNYAEGVNGDGALGIRQAVFRPRRHLQWERDSCNGLLRVCLHGSKRGKCRRYDCKWFHFSGPSGVLGESATGKLKIADMQCPAFNCQAYSASTY